MSTTRADLGWHHVAGDARARGRALGVLGRAAVHGRLLGAPIWRAATDPAHAARVARMAATTRALFPEIWAEIAGMAEGLDLPEHDVMAWTCRGDLLASVPDGCTTVMLPGAEPVIAHNEDGLPVLRGTCFIAEVAPGAAPGFRAFCYPGSIPGHTFALTDAGLVQAVNNIRLRDVAAEVPRIVLGRAVLSAGSVAEAVDLLRAAPASGGFHLALADHRTRRIASVEFGGGTVSVREVTAPALHANHALHADGGRIAQIVTRSSADRQTRGDALLADGVRDPLAILRDRAGPGLPIRRDAPDDPDAENTLATAVLRLGARGIDWTIHAGATGAPAFAGLLRL